MKIISSKKKKNKKFYTIPCREYGDATLFLKKN